MSPGPRAAAALGRPTRLPPAGREWDGASVPAHAETACRGRRLSRCGCRCRAERGHRIVDSRVNVFAADPIDEVVTLELRQHLVGRGCHSELHIMCITLVE